MKIKHFSLHPLPFTQDFLFLLTFLFFFFTYLNDICSDLLNLILHAVARFKLLKKKNPDKN